MTAAVAGPGSRRSVRRRGSVQRQGGRGSTLRPPRLRRSPARGLGAEAGASGFFASGTPAPGRGGPGCVRRSAGRCRRVRLAPRAPSRAVGDVCRRGRRGRPGRQGGAGGELSESNGGADGASAPMGSAVMTSGEMAVIIAGDGRGGDRDLCLGRRSWTARHLDGGLHSARTPAGPAAAFRLSGSTVGRLRHPRRVPCRAPRSRAGGRRAPRRAAACFRARGRGKRGRSRSPPPATTSRAAAASPEAVALERGRLDAVIAGIAPERR